MDKGGAKKAAMDAINKGRDVSIELRQIKCLNKIVDQDHRLIKRVIRLMLGFKSFRAASAVLAGIELMHMICKGQLSAEKGKNYRLLNSFTCWQHKSARG